MISFISNPNFLIPLLSTLGATFTILSLQAIHSYLKNKEKKLYALSYMLDVSRSLLHSSIIVQARTITPHIEAIIQILQGNRKLLHDMFYADDIDILTDKAMEYNHLPEEYTVLIGYDNLRLIQTFRTILYMHENNSKRKSLNDFVKANLKSMLSFDGRTDDEQIDILNTYWDYLTSLEHGENRIMALIVHIFLPEAREYLKRKYFFLSNRKSSNETIALIDNLIDQSTSVIPTTEFFQKSVTGGVQRLVKKDL